MRTEHLMPTIDLGKTALNDRDVCTQVLTEGLCNFDMTNTVKSIQLPTLALIGEKGRVIPPQHGREIADLIPNAQLIEIAGVGHLSYMEKPDSFNQAVLEYLARQ